MKNNTQLGSHTFTPANSQTNFHPYTFCEHKEEKIEEEEGHWNKLSDIFCKIIIYPEVDGTLDISCAQSGQLFVKESPSFATVVGFRLRF